jgi:hypothetical protein
MIDHHTVRSYEDLDYIRHLDFLPLITAKFMIDTTIVISR